jgi:hypothetical protein
LESFFFKKEKIPFVSTWNAKDFFSTDSNLSREFTLDTGKIVLNNIGSNVIVGNGITPTINTTYILEYDYSSSNANLYANGLISNSASGSFSFGNGTTNIGAFGSGGQYISTGTSGASAMPTSGLIGQFSIDFIGTGGGGGYFQPGVNGGGGGGGAAGGYPGGGAGQGTSQTAGAGMVIVEW